MKKGFYWSSNPSRQRRVPTDLTKVFLALRFAVFAVIIITYAYQHSA